MSHVAADPPIRIRILSDPANLCVVRVAAERFCLAVGFAAGEAEGVGLALDEALANVIRHGYDGRADQPIDVELRVIEPGTSGGGELVIRVRDAGRQVDAGCIAPRPLDEVRPGGLGVHIINSVMDRVEYSRCPDCGMQLTMVKRRSPTSRGRDDPKGTTA